MSADDSTWLGELRALFSSAPATGLCLYDRTRIPLDVIDGALCTHPVVRNDRHYQINPFYDAEVRSLRAVDPLMVTSKLAQLTPPGRQSGRPSRTKNDARKL